MSKKVNMFGKKTKLLQKKKKKKKIFDLKALFFKHNLKHTLNIFRIALKDKAI